MMEFQSRGRTRQTCARRHHNRTPSGRLDPHKDQLVLTADRCPTTASSPYFQSLTFRQSSRFTMPGKGWFNLEAASGVIPDTQFFEGESAFSFLGLTRTQRLYGLLDGERSSDGLQLSLSFRPLRGGRWCCAFLKPFAVLPI